MLIKAKDFKDIQKNKVTLVKNFVSLTREYDFNLLSNLMEENNCRISQKSNIGNLKDNVLEEFKIFNDFLSKLFKYERDSRDGLDLFFSLVSQVGNSHVDVEDVFIIGLRGITIYRISDSENKDFYIKKGDMIFIPKSIKHKVIGLSPRIVASVGFFGERK